jgi:hypothetical protein
MEVLNIWNSTQGFFVDLMEVEELIPPKEH